MADQDRHLLLSDATVPTNFCKAGLKLAQRFSDYAGDRVFIVHDVHEELLRNPKGIPALDKFLEFWPLAEPIQLAPEVREEVADALRFNARYGRHPDEDRGEHATVFHARYVREKGGREFVIATDDRDGKLLARSDGFEVVDTPEMIVRMYRHGFLNADEGFVIWKKTLPNRESAYWERIDTVQAGVN